MRLWVFRNSWFLAIGVGIGCGGSPPPAKTLPPPAAPIEKSKPPEPAESEPSGDCPSGMAAIPSGKLELGSVSAFCLDAHEVTVSEYQACENNKACTALARDAELSDRSKLCSARLSDNADLPATCVSHAEATRYCAWKGYRLPSEAEWEWAATGGEDKLPWSWGDSPPDDGKLCWQRPRGPCHVKSKAPGAFELYDLLGSVAEWTSSAYAADADRKVVRGGSWESTKEDEVRPKKRAARASASRDPSVGFRCAANR